MSTDLDLNEDLSEKVTNLEQENELLSLEINAKEKEISEIKRKYDDLMIEFNQLKESNKSQEELLKFYKEHKQSSNNSQDDLENKVKDLEIQLLNNLETVEKYEGEIKNYQEEIESYKKQKLEDDTMNEKILNLLTEKEMENNNLKKQIEELSKKTSSNEEGGLNAEDANNLKELYTNLDNEFEQYKQDHESQLTKLNNEIIEYQKNDHELREKIIDLENENNKIKEDYSILENEKNQMEQEKKNKEFEDQNYRTEFLNEIENLQNQLREVNDSKDKLVESSDQEKKYQLNERRELENQLNDLSIQKNEVEKSLNNLRISSERELNTLREKNKNDLK
jgi:chromosome segregation ATPase